MTPYDQRLQFVDGKLKIVKVPFVRGPEGRVGPTLEERVKILEKQLDILNANTEQQDRNTNMTRTEAIEKLRCIFHKTRMTKHVEVPADVVHVILYGA